MRGEMSYCKARAITRVANEETEAYLVECAGYMTGAQLETLCSKLRSVGAEPVAKERRYATRRELDDGSVCVAFRMRPEEAAMVWSVIESVGKRVSAETGEGFDRVDALVAMAEGVARGDEMRVPTELVVSVGAEALAGGGDAIEQVGLVGESAISMAVVRKLACDCGVVAVVEDAAGNPLKVGRKYRTVSGALKRALAKRDPVCQFPGCDHRVFLAGHHIDHWVDGGVTESGNLVNLCTSHHTIVHEEAIAVTLFDDRLPEFRDRWGELLVAAPALRTSGALATSRGLRCEVDGGPVDYGLIVDEVCRLG